MKKLINAPQNVVSEMLEGFAYAHPGISLLEGENVVLCADADLLLDSGHVALISGGGAGHEPAHAGYVGPGMLTAAVIGEVFTSPSTDAVLAAIRSVAGPAGVLLIIKNYTGDRLNFGLAAELARAEGIAVETVVVADDVALAASNNLAGRRGLAGCVFVHKIAGAAAQAGLSLRCIKKEAEDAIANMGTMGIALTACTLPGAAHAGFTLKNDEFELGLGIHGEPGILRSTMMRVDKLVDYMLDQILSELKISAKTRVALLVNNLGSTPAMEMALVFRRAMKHLLEKKIIVQRAWNGTFLTAIDMIGGSITLMKLDDIRINRLDAMTQAPAWPANFLGRVANKATNKACVPKPLANTCLPTSAAFEHVNSRLLRQALIATSEAWRNAESMLTKLDSMVGDGDLGLSLARGANALNNDLPSYDLQNPGHTLRALAQTVRRFVGGTTGALYAVMLLRAAAVLEQEKTPNPMLWSDAFIQGAQKISEVGGAHLGDCTMLDALMPAAEAFKTALLAGLGPSHSLESAMRAARTGAKNTINMHPKKGRASYLGERAVGHIDPGAQAIVVWLEALARVLA